MSYLTHPKGGNVKKIEDEHLDELKKMKLHEQYFNERDKNTRSLNSSFRPMARTIPSQIRNRKLNMRGPRTSIEHQIHQIENLGEKRLSTM